MKKIISFVGMFAVMGAVFGDAHGVAMSANIRRLLQEKQDKIAKLEECEGKKQGWMIAGISTIGLTAVGVGVNIAQASKSNRLSDEIEMEKTTLQRQQDELDRISNQIADERAKKAEEEHKRAEEEERRRNAANVGAGDGKENNGVVETSVVDSVIGEKCNDNKGVWLTALEGNDKKCSSNSTSGEIVDCKCVETTDGTPKPGQGSGGGDKPAEKPKTSEMGGRVVGQACIAEDINRLKPYGWLQGHYQKLGESVKTTLGVRCETKKGKGDSVNCSCRADKCDTNKGYDVDSNGLCVKKKAEEEKKQEPKQKKEEQKPAEKEQPKEITLDASVDGTDWCFYNIGGNLYVDYISGCNNPGDWGVSFPNYTVYGRAVCNGNTGKYAQASSLEQTEAGGKECWCKMTSPKESRWVFGSWSYDASDCANSCASECAIYVQVDSAFRGGVFGSVVK